MYEVFGITPEVGNLCYEYAESTQSVGRWQSQRHYTNIKPLYVGHFKRFETGGYGDNKWRTDYFEDNNGVEHVVPYSYAGTTCFRVVPCLPHIDVLNAESLATMVHRNKTNRAVLHHLNSFITNRPNPHLDKAIYYKDVGEEGEEKDGEKKDGKGQKSRRKRVTRRKRVKKSRRGQKY